MHTNRFKLCLLIYFEFLYRIPNDIIQRELWFEAINKNAEEKHKLHGNGCLCNLHFLLNDFETVKNRLQLKNGIVPSVFPQNEPVESDPVSGLEKINEPKKSCTNCDKLLLELTRKRQWSLQLRLNLDASLQQKDAKIRKMESKCNEMSLEILNLKKRITELENNAKKSMDGIDMVCSFV